MKDSAKFKLKLGGEAIRRLRQEKKISLRDLESETKICRSLLSRYESGQLFISINSLEKIADAIGMPVPYLVIELLKDKYPYLADKKNDISNILNDLSTALLKEG
ncbi:MAG: helix-turn-helix domain-containing protein [Anaerohalosphaeraceae bacterium]|nr:helix-turn-helix domain-containing protein [Anaerohalosphaeraceae bacterium]